LTDVRKEIMKTLRRIALITVVVSVVALGTLSSRVVNSATPSNWPQWRGPDGSGISTAKNIPAEWSDSKNIKWKTPIEGRSHSSPIVWGNQIFLTTAIEGAVVPGAKAVKHMDGDKEYVHPDSVGANKQHKFNVISIDGKTGKVLWDVTAWEGTPYDDRHRKSSYAASTPATDGKYVYAFFGTEGIYAYDFKGKLAWKVSLPKMATVGMGTGTSPILFNNLVIIQCDEESGAASFMLALDKKTGKEVWKSARQVQMNWSTPLLVRTATRSELIASGTELIIGYDPATGKELWRHKGLQSNAVPSPIANSDTVFVVSGYPTKIAMAIKLGQNGDLTGTANVPWKYSKGTAYVPSPIAYGDYVYLLTDRGILTCIDAKTGEVKYEGGRIPIPATFTASPVAFDGKILLTSEDGDTFIIKAGPKHEILGTNSVGEPVYASPAIADGRVFIRGEKHLYCIGS
jgi:outer membrane protein assembly factor BamB